MSDRTVEQMKTLITADLSAVEKAQLIASVCYRLQAPLYTHNVKHMARLLDPRLVMQPY